MPARRTVIALTVLALAVRVATLDLQSLWSDEAATAIVLDRSLRDVLRAVWDGESTPPLFYVVDWVWSRVAGDGEVALRLPSAVAGALTVPVVAALAARLRPQAPGVAAGVAAALAALSPLMVWYGQEARAYALLMLLTAGSMLALLRAVETPSRGRLAVWAVLAIASFWTHHFALFLVVGQGLWLLWAVRGRAVVAVGVVAAGAAGLAPLLLHQRAAGRASFIGDTPLHTRLAQVPKQVLAGYDGPAEAVFVGLGAAAVCVALTGLVVGVRGRARAPEGPDGVPPGAVVLGVVAVGGLLPVAAALIGQDFLLTRNLLGALPLVLALLAAGLVALPGRAGRAAGVAGAAVLVGSGAAAAVAVATDRAYQRDDFRGAVEATLDGPARPRLIVADGASSVPARFYLGRDAQVVVPGPGYAVREIDVVLVAGAEPGRKRSTPEIPASPVPGGFRPAGEERGETWAVRRFVARRPVVMDPGLVYRLNPRGGAIAFFRPR